MDREFAEVEITCWFFVNRIEMAQKMLHFK